MQSRDPQRYKVSWHLRDLMKRDPAIVQDVCNWLEKRACTKRDLANGTGSRRMLARMVAAQIALKAARDGDVQAAREVMDRTEGKVADVVISGSFTDLVNALEAGRERLIAAREPQHLVVEGEVVAPVEPDPQPTSTESDSSK